MPQLLLLLLVLVQGDKFELVQGTNGSRAEILDLHAGGLVLHEGEAGAAFATVRAGSRKRQLAYLVFLKHRLTNNSTTEFADEVKTDDLTGESKHSLTLGKATLKIDYRVDVDANSKKSARESLSFNGKVQDLARGRVFLVDMTVNPPRWQQRKANLPAEVPEATTKKAAESLVRKVQAELIKEDGKLKEFLEEARK